MPQDPTPQPNSPVAAPDIFRPDGSFSARASGLMVAIILIAILAVMFIPFSWNDQVSLSWVGLRYIAPNLSDKFGNPWEFPTHSVMGGAVGGTLLATLFGLGYGLLTWVRPWRRMLPRPVERATLALPVAAVPASLGVFGLGLAGQANAAALNGWLVLLLAASVPGWVHYWGELRQSRRRGRARGGERRPMLIATLLGIILALSLIYALAPSSESDELRYHFSAPAAWLRDGRIHYLPYQAFSNFPMLSEMLFMLVMPLGGTEAAKLIHLGFLPVCIGLIGLIARRLIGPYRRGGDAPFLAGAAFAFIPTVPILAAWGFIEIFVTAYFLSFVYLAGRALVRPSRAAGSLLGVIGGGAISVKYTLVALLGGLGGLWTLLLARSGRGRRHLARLAGMTVLFTVICGGAWYLKNYAWTGNPVYPGAVGIFDGGEWTQDNQARFRAKTKEKGMHLDWLPGGAGRAVEFLVSPVTTTFFPHPFDDNPLGPLPMMALVVALGGVAACRRMKCAGGMRRLFGVWILIAILVSWVAWFLTYQSNRFLLPTAALVLALGSRALAGWRGMLGAAPRRILHGLLALGFVYSFLYTLTQFLAPWYDKFNPNPVQVNKSDAFAVALGFEDRNLYLAHRLTYWPAARWLAGRARPGEKVLLIGEHRTLYFDLPVVASDWFDTPQPIPWLRQSKDNEAMLDLLLKDGVRYIFYNKAELSIQDQFRRYFLPRFTPAQQQRFLGLWNSPRLKQIYPAAEREGIMIYEISK